MTISTLLNDDFNYIPLNELYFGRKPLAKLKDRFDALHIWCNSNKGKVPYREKVYDDFIKETCRTFGLSDFRLVLELGDGIEASTYAVNVNPATIVDNKHLYLVNSELGLKFSPIYAFKTVIMLSRATMYTLSADQTFAVYLHEMGHSFEAVVRFGAAQVSLSFMEMCATYVPLYQAKYPNIEPIDAMTKFVNKLIKDDKALEAEEEWLSEDLTARKKRRDIRLKYLAISATFKSVYTNIKAIGQFLFGKSSRAKDASDVNTKSRGNEYFCDSFATMYGYGAELNSAHLNTRLYNEDSFIAAYYEFIELPRYVLTSTSHPTIMSRSKAIIAHLRFELKNNKTLNAAEKKNIEDSIITVEESLTKYLDDKDGSRYDKVIRMGNKMVELFFGTKIGKDLNNADYDFGIKFK